MTPVSVFPPRFYYVYFWWWIFDVIDLSYSFCNLLALLFKVSYFICGVCRWLIWLWDSRICF